MLYITETDLQNFRAYLAELERSKATISKYIHDARALMEFAPEGIDGQAQLGGFRPWLEAKELCASSINSMFGAANQLLAFLGSDLRLRYIKVQRQTFLPADRELTRKEYEKLVQAAREKGDRRLELLVQTLCAVGLRVSELRFITVESLGCGVAEIDNKGKKRMIQIPKSLAAQLTPYCTERGIKSGSVFITRTGKPMDRSNIWKMLKKLAEAAKVLATKVFPHNLRHLFARTHYKKFKDLAGLADLMGHSSINTTRIYTATSGKEERRQLDSLCLVLG